PPGGAKPHAGGAVGSTLGSQTQLPWITGAAQLRLHAGAERLKFAHESAAATAGTASATAANRTRSPRRIPSPFVDRSCLPRPPLGRRPMMPRSIVVRYIGTFVAKRRKERRYDPSNSGGLGARARR